MTNHKDTLIEKLFKESGSFRDSENAGMMRITKVIDIINQHFDAVPDGDRVERVAKIIAGASSSGAWEEWIPTAKAAIEAMGTAEPTDNKSYCPYCSGSWSGCTKTKRTCPSTSLAGKWRE